MQSLRMPHLSLIALLCALTLPAAGAFAQEEFDIDFEPEYADGMPQHDLDADVPAIVDEILNRPSAAKEIIYNRFGEEFVAELLRVLAGWRDESAKRAYERLMGWNVEFFYEFLGTMGKRFVGTVVDLRGPGADRVRADVAVAILGAIEDSEGAGAMLEGADYLSALLQGPEGAKMILWLEARSLSNRVVPLLTHTLIYHPVGGQQIVGEMLGTAAHQVALRVKGGYFADDDVARAQARLLGRTITHVELAVDEWAATKNQGPKASAAHGAAIVRSALSAIDTLTGGLSSAVTGPIRMGVDWLEDYETSREEPPEDPAAELRHQMLEAVITPFHKLVTDDVTLEEEEIHVMVELFRKNVEEGRNSTWTR